MADFTDQLAQAPAALSKFEIAKTLLPRLNDGGDQYLTARREVVRRVVQFDNLAACWPDDQDKVKALLADIRSLVGAKDAFTRMQQERETERQERLAAERARVAAAARRRDQRDAVKTELCALVAIADLYRRAKELERVLNRLFAAYGIAVRDAFTLSDAVGASVVEQIDGVVALDGEFYLVEMKWWAQPLGPGEVGQHLVRLFGRSEARGIVIATEGYTPAAVLECTRALRDRVVVLCTLQELVQLLDQDGDLGAFLRRKVEAAVIDRNPFFQPLAS